VEEQEWRLLPDLQQQVPAQVTLCILLQTKQRPDWRLTMQAENMSGYVLL